MTKLSDLQSILLTAAVQQDCGSLLPAPTSIADAGKRLTTALARLARHGLVDERPVRDAPVSWRKDGDVRFGLFINDAGRKAIGVEPTGESGNDPAAPPPATAVTPERQTKSALVINLLQRGEGATLTELVEATGWLRHTTRAALTGLRKKGHVIDKSKRDDATCYRIAAKA